MNKAILPADFVCKGQRNVTAVIFIYSVNG